MILESQEATGDPLDPLRRVISGCHGNLEAGATLSGGVLWKLGAPQHTDIASLVTTSRTSATMAMCLI